MAEAPQIPPAESLTVEFKGDRKVQLSDRDLALAAVCLANAHGGDLYLGVEDNGVVTGLHPSRDRTRNLAAVIGEFTTPPLGVTVEPLTLEGQPVLQIQVPPIQGTVFTRDGRCQIRGLDQKGKPFCRPATAVDVLRRANQQLEVDWSAQPAPAATQADLDPAERQRLRAMVRTYRGDETLLELSDDELDGALALVVPDSQGTLQPTFAGLLLIGHAAAIRRCIPGHECGFQVLQGTEVRINRFLRSPLLALVEEVEQRIDPFISEQELEVGLFRVPVPNLKKRAFREAFINALAHRDYTRLAAVHVTWQLGEQLVISNPGGFVRGVTIDTLLSSPPRSRNPVLADALKRIGLAERTGRGIDRIYEGMLESGRAAPNYGRSSLDDVVVELSTQPANLQLVALWYEHQRRAGEPLGLLSLLLLHTLHEQRRLTTAQLAAQLHRDEAVVRRHLEQLVEADLVAAQSQGRGRSYTLSQPVYRAFDQEAGYARQAVLSSEEIDRRILALARETQQLRRRDVLQAIGLEKNQATHALQRLSKRGDLIPEGQGKGRVYRPGPGI
jgi:ATP-dependent DNA helicase RecG